jgi:translocation and assembly module TamB
VSTAPSPPPNLNKHAAPPAEPPFRPLWQRLAIWIGIGLAALIVIVIVAGVILLQSNWFHQYLLGVAQEKASATLGTQVRLRDYTLSFSGISPTADLYNVAVEGAQPYPNPPVLTADHIRAAVRVVSILHLQWYLNELRIDHPVAHVLVDRDGRDNLPVMKSTGQSHTSVFDLGVRHAIVTSGEAYYNNRKSALDADLHDLQFRSAFNTALREYSGTLSYRDGHLVLGSYNPIPHDLQAQFSVTPWAFTLQRAVLTSGASRIVLSANLQNYSNPRAEAKYDAVIDAGQFRQVLKNASLPSGVIHMSGSLQYLSQPNRPMLETVTLNGDVNSSSLQVQTSNYTGMIRDLAARYSLAHGNLDVRDLRARVLGGDLSGTLTMWNVAGSATSGLAPEHRGREPGAPMSRPPHSSMSVALRGVSLAELKPLANSPALEKVDMAGTADADATASWGKTMDNLVAQTDVTVQGSMSPSGGPTSAKAGQMWGTNSAIPFNAGIHATYSAPAKQITLAKSHVNMPQTALTLDGTISEHSSLQVNLQSQDLHELETAAILFHPSSQPLGLYGSASFVGAVSGSTSAPQIVGRMSATNVRVRGSTWRAARANVNVGPSMASLQNGEAQPASGGSINFSVSAGLKHYAFSDTSPVQIAVRASQINVADLTKTAGVQAPVQGTLSANIGLHGSEVQPVGQGTISLTQAKISGQPVQSAVLKFQGTGNELQGNFGVRLPAGTAQSTFTIFPKQQGYVVQLAAHGIQVAKLAAVQSRNLHLAGTVNLDASGRGTFQNPELQATVQIPQLRVQNQTISGIALQAAVANHVANLELNSNVVNTQLQARARINLAGACYTEATLNTQTIPLEPLVAMYAPSQAGNINGQTELHATLRGPLRNRSQIDAHVVIPTLQVNYANKVQIGAAGPIRADYANNVLTVQRTAIRGTGTDLQFQGTIPLQGAAPVSLLLLGTIDLRLAQLFDPDITSSGQIRFNINSFGHRANPDVQGEVQIVNATFAAGTLPIGLQNGNGTLRLTKDRLDITTFKGSVGGGTVTAKGGVIYRPSLRFDLALEGRGMRFLYPQGVRETLDTNLTLTGTTDSAMLRGQVRVDQLSFTPDFDLAKFIGQFTGGITPAPAQGFAQNVQLNVGVQSTTGLNLVSRMLSFQGVANLRVQGTLADPVIIGRVNVNGGDAIFNGHRFVLQGGTVDFVNPSETQPVLNLSASTTIDQYNIQLQFNGPLDHLRTNYASDPALPQSDIISLLAFGKTTEASAANPAPGNLAAESAVASQVSNQVTSRVERIAGISQISLDPLLGCNQQQKGACITIRQRVTGQIFVTFQTDLTSAQRDTVQVEYQYTPRVSFSGTRDQYGGFGFDTRIKKTW